MQWDQQKFVTQWNEDAWKRFTESLKKNILRSNRMHAFRSDSEELVLFRISWAQSDKHLLALFSKWLASNRPIPFQKQGTLGRSHPLPKKRTDLEHLRKYLIVQEAGDWNVDVGRNRLFRDRSKWNECSNAVERILTDLSSYPSRAS
jgi:hypothetical protein